MKQNAIASLAALALLSAGSLAYAAEVTGGNVAVVVQRASVPSASGYQLLCVPVKGLDITGATEAKPLTLDQVLPPAAYGIKPTDAGNISGTTQCRVTVFGASGMVEAKITATTSDGGTTYTYAWTAEDGRTPKGPTELACGTVLWFYNPADISLTQAAGGGAFAGLASASLLADDKSSKTTQVTFCGQQNEDQTRIAPEGTAVLKKIGNETSEPIPLSQLFNDDTCLKGTQVFRIAKPGDANYTIYAKKTSSWTKYHPQGGLTANFNMSTEMLQPGEAVYYYGVAPADAN